MKEFALLTGIVLIIIAMYRTSKKKPSTLFWIGWAICSVLYIGATPQSNDQANDTTPIQTAATPIQTTKQQVPTEQKRKEQALLAENIGMTPEDFEDKFNSVGSVLSDRIAIQVDVLEGEVQDALQSKVNDSTFITGTVHKNTGIIRDIGITGANFEGQEATDYINMIATLVSVTNPKVTTEEIWDMLMNDMDFTNTVENYGSSEYSLNGIRYSLMVSKEIGIWFGAGKDISNN